MTRFWGDFRDLKWSPRSRRLIQHNDIDLSSVRSLWVCDDYRVAPFVCLLCLLTYQVDFKLVDDEFDPFTLRNLCSALTQIESRSGHLV